MKPPAPHSPHSDVAQDLAHRLLAREAPSGGDDATLLAAGERLCLLVPDGLSRWFGTYGSRALLARALAKAQRDHPSLSRVSVTNAQSPCVVGLAESARVHGAKAVAEGIVAVLAALADIIAGLIGDDLVVNLLEQSAAASAAHDHMAPGGDSVPPGQWTAKADVGTTSDVSQTVNES